LVCLLFRYRRTGTYFQSDAAPLDVFLTRPLSSVGSQDGGLQGTDAFLLGAFDFI
jgi:hypothetical protein